MSAETIMSWWLAWLGLAGVLVAVVAALLLAIIVQARSIGRLAGSVLDVVGEIEVNTRPVWQLNATNRVAAELAAGAESIAGDAEEAVSALTHTSPTSGGGG